jgi:hypothetical protein
MRKEITFKHLRNILVNANREQIDAFSRYLHSVSLAALISMASLPFSENEMLLLVLKELCLLMLAGLLFFVGVIILKKC